ncbi:MAG: hypothetical protein RL122_1945 [Pseudomonadota bacterium]|jgi:uncharacterized protein (DUF58 family)|uniref:DUF58 domain-containing protein n=1 Tax=Thiothrix fructosivorans TaxID=111770 RepID=A0A8B0SL44_9GAMM|nr:DUF58 domain-containing protein [Thiothrix fructosivorans]MBO0612860.1 DUF58 domain-containing protein [Thiothrix fructosivorans]QTX11684.1 DUF58 domain-containing protein [Thiothrix fructosivorans]
MATLNLRNIYIIPSKTALGLLSIIALLFLLGINFQNSLVYIISFWLLALLLLNIFYTWRNLAGLTLTAVGIEPCFAGEKAVLEVELSRPTPYAKYALELTWEDAMQVQIDLISTQTARIKLSHSTQQRGRFTPPRLKISTRYPTGLALAWAYVHLDIHGVVYPAPVEKAFQAQGESYGDNSESGLEITGGTNDFGGIRDYQYGDAPKRVHWAKFAQTGKLYTKTFVDYASHEVWLDWETLPMPGIEVRLSHLCRKVLECHQEQRQYGLKLPGKVIAPDKGDAHKARCLQALALFGLAND